MRSLRAALAAAALLGAASARAEVLRLGPLRIRGAHAPMAGPFITQSIDFPKDVVLRSASVVLLGPDGKPDPDQTLLCHVTLADSDASHMPGKTPHVLTLDLGTRRLDLPDGYGVRLAANRRYLVNAMLASNDPAVDREETFLITLDVAEAAAAGAPRAVAAHTVGLRAQDAGQDGVTGDFDWLVPPGRHEYSRTVPQPETETVRALSAHLHRYASSVRIAEAGTGKKVFEGAVERGADGTLLRAPVWNAAAPLVLKAGTRYVWTAVYDNTGREPMRAMATFYVFEDPPAP